MTPPKTQANRHSKRKRGVEQLWHHETNHQKSWTKSHRQPHFKLFGSQEPCSMPIGLSILEGLD